MRVAVRMLFEPQTGFGWQHLAGRRLNVKADSGFGVGNVIGENQNEV